MIRPKKSAMGSSKYEFEPDLFEKDVAEQFKKDLRETLYKDYKYHNGTKMSNKAKKEFLTEVHLEFLEVEE